MWRNVVSELLYVEMLLSQIAIIFRRKPTTPFIFGEHFL